MLRPDAREIARSAAASEPAGRWSGTVRRSLADAAWGATIAPKAIKGIVDINAATRIAFISSPRADAREKTSVGALASEDQKTLGIFFGVGRLLRVSAKG
ncbi:MAG TPA: hypothetical protein VF409_14320 [Sphingomonas sp.]